MGQVEVSTIVEADLRELFSFADWCYNLPLWFPAIRKAWIVQLPDATGLGKVTHYIGTMMGRDLEWQAQASEWREDEVFVMRAVSGLPGKMNLQFRVQFAALGPGKTQVRGALGFRAPYPLIGYLIDSLYIKKEARRLATTAIQGLKRAAEERRIPSLSVQAEQREADHPGYVAPSILA